jgi:hypothetical protein
MAFLWRNRGRSYMSTSRAHKLSVWEHPSDLECEGAISPGALRCARRLTGTGARKTSGKEYNTQPK